MTAFQWMEPELSKGLGDEKIVGKVIKAIDGMDRKTVIKTDGEPALVGVQEAIARERAHDTVCGKTAGL